MVIDVIYRVVKNKRVLQIRIELTCTVRKETRGKFIKILWQRLDSEVQFIFSDKNLKILDRNNKLIQYKILTAESSVTKVLLLCSNFLSSSSFLSLRSSPLRDCILSDRVFTSCCTSLSANPICGGDHVTCYM